MAATPESVIGEAAVAKLRLAGFEIVRAERPEHWRWTCPHCGRTHEPAAGKWGDVFADWGECWCRHCVTSYQTAPSKRGSRRPMSKVRIA